MSLVLNSSDFPLKKWTPYTNHSKNESIQSFSCSTQADGYWATQSSRPTANWPSTIMAIATIQYKDQWYGVVLERGLRSGAAMLADAVAGATGRGVLVAALMTLGCANVAVWVIGTIPPLRACG